MDMDTIVQTELPILARLFCRGDEGEDVQALQTALTELGIFGGHVDGHFGPDTEAAVKAFQRRFTICVDGRVGAETWAKLGGSYENQLSPELWRTIANIAQREAEAEYKWKIGGEADKYLELLRAPMREVGDLGQAQDGYFHWCAAFTYWVCTKAGLEIPAILESADKDTMARVDSWVVWAKEKGYWHPEKNFVPRRGDIFVLDSWSHIGIVKGYTKGETGFQTCEGNYRPKANSPDTETRTASVTRHLDEAKGFIRIEDSDDETADS